jgi:hypothetical protein
MFSPTASVETGDLALMIEMVAKEIGADLVVIGHRRQGRSRASGSARSRSTRRSSACSVLVSRNDIPDDVLGEMQRQALRNRDAAARINRPSPVGGVACPSAPS